MTKRLMLSIVTTLILYHFYKLFAQLNCHFTKKRQQHFKNIEYNSI